MIEINNAHININEIKARIKEEAARHRKIGDFIEYPCYDEEASAAQIRPFDGGLYHYSDFLQFHGQDFINKAYQTILHREPDPEGSAFYFEKLARADLTKADILGRLRYSREGRQKKVSVKGLLFPFLIQTVFKIPFLGGGLRVAVAMLNLPTILKNLQRLESTVVDQNHCLLKAKREIDILKKSVLYNRMAWETESSEKERQIAGLKAAILAAEKELGRWMEKTSVEAKKIELQMLDMDRRVRMVMEEIRKELSVAPSRPSLESVLREERTHGFDLLYLGLEERFRGPEAAVRELAEIYLPHVKSAIHQTGNGSLLDVGCGRGEWLCVLKEHHISASGVDLNRAMVDKCQEAGLSVTLSDAVSHLRSLQRESISVITGFHIVEHLSFNTLISLFDEAIRALKPGGMMVVETPNPENLAVGAFTFYLDPTHKRPIPPETLSYLMEARGFVRIQIARLHSNPHVFFENPLLNQYLAVGQDYSVMGFKA